MATVRRVVTGHRTDGKSIIASDQAVPGLELPGVPGARLTTCGARTKHSRTLMQGGNRVIMSGFRRSAGFALSNLSWLRTAPRLQRVTRRPPQPKSSACFRVCWQPCSRTILACIARPRSTCSMWSLGAVSSNSTMALKLTLAPGTSSSRAVPCIAGITPGQSRAESSACWLARNYNSAVWRHRLAF